MTHPQNSPRGLFTKQAIALPVGKGIFFEDYSTGTALVNADGRGLSLVGSGIKFSTPRTSSSLPSSDLGASVRMVVNTTGETALAINTTADRWKYFAVTGVLRTANVSN